MEQLYPGGHDVDLVGNLGSIREHHAGTKSVVRVVLYCGARGREAPEPHIWDKRNASVHWRHRRRGLRRRNPGWRRPYKLGVWEDNENTR